MVIKERPPWQVVLAVRLAVLSYLMGALSLILYWDYFSTMRSAQSVLVNLGIALIFFIWIYYKIYAGRNWARITLLVILVLVGLMTMSSVFMDKISELLAPAPAVVKAQMIAGLVISLIILGLLFVSPGRSWFRPKSAGSLASQ